MCVLCLAQRDHGGASGAGCRDASRLAVWHDEWTKPFRVRVTWSAEGLHVVGTSTWWVGAVRAESEYMYLYYVQSFI